MSPYARSSLAVSYHVTDQSAVEAAFRASPGRVTPRHRSPAWYTWHDHIRLTCDDLLSGWIASTFWAGSRQMVRRLALIAASDVFGRWSRLVVEPVCPAIRIVRIGWRSRRPVRCGITKMRRSIRHLDHMFHLFQPSSHLFQFRLSFDCCSDFSCPSFASFFAINIRSTIALQSHSDLEGLVKGFRFFVSRLSRYTFVGKSIKERPDGYSLAV